MSDGGQAFHLVEAANPRTAVAVVEEELLNNGGGIPADCSVLSGQASSTQKPHSCVSVRQPSVMQSLIMKTWSKTRGIPQGLAEQQKTEREQGAEEDEEGDEEWSKWRSDGDDGEGTGLMLHSV